jgi:hypothetical protein
MNYMEVLILGGLALWMTGVGLVAWPGRLRVQSVGVGGVMLAPVVWLAALAVDRTGPLETPYHDDCNHAYIHRAEAANIEVSLVAILAIAALALIGHRSRRSGWYRAGVVLASTAVIVGSAAYHVFWATGSC